MPQFERLDEGVRLRLDDAEGHVFRKLLDELRDLLARRSSDDPAVARLYPDAYESPQDEQAYRELVGDDLHRHKLRAIEDVRHALGRRGGAAVDLTGERLDLWLGLLTDLRLAIGIRLGVDEEMMSRELDPADPAAPALGTLHWLGFVQDTIVRTVTADAE